jgi:hypothetical protein
VRQVAQARNDIEHAGFCARPLPADALREQIGKLVEGLADPMAATVDASPGFLNISIIRVPPGARHSGSLNHGLRGTGSNRFRADPVGRIFQKLVSLRRGRALLS